MIFPECLLAMVALLSAQATPDETPAAIGEWGFRPTANQVMAVNPPAFSWRPQQKAVAYQVELRPLDPAGKAVISNQLQLPVYCPSQPLVEGDWQWRFRYIDESAAVSAWSQPRSFHLPPGVPKMVMPDRAELRRRLPSGHPRLMLRPEDLPSLRARAQGDLAEAFATLRHRAQDRLAKPLTVVEPPLYPPEVKYKSERWREIWWGNRRKTIEVLQGAAEIAFVALVDQDPALTREAVRLLMAAAAWNPTGATGYRYNDEAGMPYAYWFARTYTLVHHALTEAQREKCRQVIRVRGGEMYRHLAPRHLWQPYSSHSNRAWHFLGELGIAFHGEIAEAEDWLFFATRVFAAAYPVWSDEDGGWHEGINYWRSYLGRFTWWADAMRAALAIDAYRKPFFSRVGDFALYLQPPGTTGGGFGDLSGRMTSRHQAEIMALFATAAQNPTWQWYADAHGVEAPLAGYIDFLRLARPQVAARAPHDLPTSRLFAGTGVAVLNTNLLDAHDNVELIFKSSPFGSQSHGYEAQNSFLLYAFGERLLIRSGQRDLYGSDHHRNWMWSSRSTNTITAGGRGQTPHSPRAVGEIRQFHTSSTIDFVAGEAGAAYPHLQGFERRILFLKPDWIIIHDQLQATEAMPFTWWLHALSPMEIHDREVVVRQGKAACRVFFMAPAHLQLAQTDRFDPPPRERVKLTQYHLTGTSEAASQISFLTVLRPLRAAALDQDRGMVESSTDGDGVILRLSGVGATAEIEVSADGMRVQRGGDRLDTVLLHR